MGLTSDQTAELGAIKQTNQSIADGKLLAELDPLKQEFIGLHKELGQTPEQAEAAWLKEIPKVVQRRQDVADGKDGPVAQVFGTGQVFNTEKDQTADVRHKLDDIHHKLDEANKLLGLTHDESYAKWAETQRNLLARMDGKKPEEIQTMLDGYNNDLDKALDTARPFAETRDAYYAMNQKLRYDKSAIDAGWQQEKQKVLELSPDKIKELANNFRKTAEKLGEFMQEVDDYAKKVHLTPEEKEALIKDNIEAFRKGNYHDIEHKTEALRETADAYRDFRTKFDNGMAIYALDPQKEWDKKKSDSTSIEFMIAHGTMDAATLRSYSQDDLNSVALKHHDDLILNSGKPVQPEPAKSDPVKQLQAQPVVPADKPVAGGVKLIGIGSLDDGTEVQAIHDGKKMKLIDGEGAAIAKGQVVDVAIALDGGTSNATYKVIDDQGHAVRMPSTPTVNATNNPVVNK